MNKYGYPTWTRRQMLGRLGAAAGAGVLGLRSSASAAEPLPETTRVRLMYDHNVPVLCISPILLVEDFLRLEGFTDIEYVGYGDAVSESQILIEDRVDFAATLGSDYVVGIDKGGPITVLSGLHVGCTEMFASKRVRNIRDLAGKRLCAGGPGSAMHVFFSAIVAFVGLDPTRDVEWVWEPDFNRWPDLLQQGKADAMNAFPPQNLEIRERQIGHVILNTTTDDPWRNFFCCMVASRAEFVRRYPAATKRVIRAFAMANQLCELESERTAKRIVELGASKRYDFALKTLQDVPYGTWRDHDPRDTIRFFALRLREAGIIKGSPRDILAKGTDFRFLEEVRRELKT